MVVVHSDEKTGLNRVYPKGVNREKLDDKKAASVRTARGFPFSRVLSEGTDRSIPADSMRLSVNAETSSFSCAAMNFSYLLFTQCCVRMPQTACCVRRFSSRKGSRTGLSGRGFGAAFGENAVDSSYKIAIIFLRMIISNKRDAV